MANRAFVESSFLPAPGRVLESGLRKEIGGMSGTQTRTSAWVLYVHYEYWIGGQHFQSQRIASHPPSSNSPFDEPPSEELKALVDTYAVGEEITVHVSADDPTWSVLIKASFFGVWFAALGLGLTAIGALLYFRLI